ncbi:MULTISPECIES: prepilin-type N-terminal cleavage/methylation domain-containing protein [Aeromonas]|uniref:Prepilin-type N-terminal cleavage/methylation domain-containing protein n=5 Tax=Aeromonadaceae TaxID=84642 RepID=A0A5F0KBR9_9GAMM|nr:MULTISPECIES: prepilin-type N-terminal cleavage/methylation domain-containing protein [Aeromonas]ELB2793505.1 prepilin-type N-terminal cleavage/methylation domain-containing protein [Aeromonas hydrophila]TFF75994.1 prepilin-type N-terminal cleavage/methylation domain-containing protein [Aeromonas taiwanensis]MBS2783039.1 prepilin-type N-terminal cleavage/methylation domain-containing protein [Aeromonas salmonicida]TFF76502.1 prepilin-type N-terminal cleavage/methylation domain-containing pro
MMNYVNQNNEIMASKKQGGFTLIEFSIVVAIAAVLLVVVLQVAEGVKYQTKQEALIKQMQQITTATERWKKGRPNKNGVSMSVLCATGSKLLDASVCGTAKDGKAANAFGGDITVVANTTNPSLVDITMAGLPADYITDLADTLAPMTTGRCQTATGCTTITVTGSSVKGTM